MEHHTPPGTRTIAQAIRGTLTSSRAATQFWWPASLSPQEDWRHFCCRSERVRPATIL